MRRGLPFLSLLAVPEAAHACAVCGAAMDRNNTAFIITTILLSLLPLAMTGAALWWIARHAGGHLAGELAEREAQVGAPVRPAGAGEG